MWHYQLGLTKNYASCSNPWGGQFYTKMSGYPLFTIIINTVGRFSTRVNSCCSKGIEVNPCQFDVFRYFSGGAMTCKHKQSHERELGLATSTVVCKKKSIFFIYKMKVSSRAETFQDVSLPIPGKNDVSLRLTKCTLVKSLLSATFLWQPFVSVAHLCHRT